MNYLFIMLMAGLSIIFAILSSFSKDDNLSSIFKWGAGFTFLITGLLIYMYGIDIPIGTLTTLVR